MKSLTRIMLIDDNKLDNFFHKRVINKYDATLEVIEMLSAIDALEYLKECKTNNHPDIIFLDINMPGMNGWEFLEEYKRIPEDLRTSMVVVMLTTSENPNEKERASQDSSLTGFISKPLSTEALKNVLETFNKDYSSI